MNLPASPHRPIAFYQALPKIDLHRHLEGSLRFETIRELALQNGLDLPATDRLRQMVQVQANQPQTFKNFLSKFSILRLLYRSREIIERVTREAIADAAADNIRYLEMRFTPVALSRAHGFSLSEVMNWVISAARQAERDFAIKTRLIASFNRHESVDLAAQVSSLAAERLSEGIVGLDLSGNEAEFSAKPFSRILTEARQQGLHIAVHAGEWGPGENVYQAIQELGAERIGHGIRVMENPPAVALARERLIPFEVCLTSNYQSGVINALKAHPARAMVAAGINVTINSDNPGISQITLSDEYRLAIEVLGFHLSEIKERLLAAAQAAFLPAHERQQLADMLLADFPSD